MRIRDLFRRKPKTDNDYQVNFGYALPSDIKERDREIDVLARRYRGKHVDSGSYQRKQRELSYSFDKKIHARRFMKELVKLGYVEIAVLMGINPTDGNWKELEKHRSKFRSTDF